MCGRVGKRGAGIADQQLSKDQIEKSPCPKTGSRPLKETQEMHASQNVKKPAQLVSRKRHAAVSLCCASVPARGGKSRFARLGERANPPRGPRQPLALPVRAPKSNLPAMHQHDMRSLASRPLTEKRALRRNDRTCLGARDQLSRSLLSGTSQSFSAAKFRGRARDAAANSRCTKYWSS